MGILDNIGKTIGKFGKTITGYQAYQDRKKASDIRDQIDSIVGRVEKRNKQVRKDTKKALNAYGETMLGALHSKVGKFLKYMDYIGVRNKEKEYEILRSIDISPEKIQEMEQLDMNAQSALGTTAIAGTAAAIALTGVPTAVTGAVSALATASTGTAISSLSGAAATNATLAWLGGGSLATGGGGMAAGAAVLSGITWAATGVVAVASAGLIAGSYYSKKLTEAEANLSEVRKWEKNVQQGWVIMEAVQKRAYELKNTVIQLESRSAKMLRKIEPLVYDFDTDNQLYVQLFQQNALLAKTIGEIAQIPLMDQQGNLNNETYHINMSAQRLLNTSLKE